MRWKLLILVAAVTSVTKSVDVEVTIVETNGNKNWTSTINQENSLKISNVVNETKSHHHSVKREEMGKKEEKENGNTDEDLEEPETEDTVVIVETDKGLVKGYEMPGTTGILQFLDIPYGKYVKNFEKPAKANKWEGVRDITEHTIVCPHLDSENNYKGKRDCLTISIFASYNVTKASVLVHIHDGDFLYFKNNKTQYSPENLVSRGIILVIPNFRIGAFGFLCLQNQTALGNAGLKDLALALEWIAQNIAHFGGNPNDVTVSGVDKAGALVGHLMLSPKTRHYFTKAITESGSVLSDWALDRNPLDTALDLAEILRNDYNIVQSNIFAEDINEMDLVLASKDVTFRPCIETNSDAFITESPWSILQNHKTNISLMAGTANHAGFQEALKANLTLINNHFEIILPQDLHFDKGEQQRIDTAKKLRTLYFGKNEITDKTDLENISLCYTDSLYLGPDIRTARYLISAGAKVYFFEFAFVDKTEEAILKGAQRGDVIKYVFAPKKSPLDTEISLETDGMQYMTELMTDFWLTFIQEGTPTSQNVSWAELSPVSETDEAWLSIDLDVILLKGLHIERLALWTEIYNDHYVEHNFATHRRPLLFILYMSISFTLKLSLVF